jgi:Spy/CpxP family protein refolding chaperone
MNRSLKWKLIAGFILVFLAGAMTGVFFAATFAHHMFVEFHQPGLVAARMKERLRKELKLTSDQEAKISPIVEKMAAQLEQIRKETGERVRQTFKNAHQEMEADLTAEQRQKLREMEKRHHAWHIQHGGHGPPPPGEIPP